jgi:pimeloyl-ACP methyl ester carboxylesterase
MAILALALLAASLPATPSSFGYLTGLFLTLLGPLLPTKRALVALAGLAMVLGIAALRMSTADRTGMLRLPAGSPSHTGRLFEERDLALAGVLLSGPLHVLPRGELEGVLAATREAYSEMEADVGRVPTPVLHTSLLLQHPDGFDVVVFEPKAKTERALVFLHGYTGNTTLLCWLVAHPAAEAGLTTVCPSMDFIGRWASEPGERTLTATLAWLKARGVKRVVLGGLSNGGVGASVLAEGHRSEIEGLLLVSGSAPESSPPVVPALLLHGSRDSMMTVEVAREFAARSGGLARSVEVPEGHFALLMRRQELGFEIATWLRGLPPRP